MFTEKRAPTYGRFWLLLPALLVAAVLSVGTARAGLPASDSTEQASTSTRPGVPEQTSTPPPGCGEAWRVVTSPNVATAPNSLTGIAALSQDDIWAVGYTGLSYAAAVSLIEHWDGAQWSVVTSPNSGSGEDVLMGVAAISPNDVWAVGMAYGQTLTEHWDGTQWTIMPSPSVPGYGNQLNGVAAVSANDVWAVGYYGNTTGDSRTLIEHWDGMQWIIMPSPNIGTVENELYAVTAISATDAWAVGRIGTWGAREQTLSLHWDGTSWNVVSNPNPPPDPDEYRPYALYAVDGTASNDVWAVGVYRNNSWSRTLAEHWDGSQWTIESTPNGNILGDNEFHAISALSANDVWAVGYYLDNYYSGDDRTFVAHWDGAQWSASPSPYLDRNNRLTGVAAVSPQDVWAVGFYGPTYSDVLTLAVHFNDPCGGRTSTPAVTRTSSPTATPPCTTVWTVPASPNTGTGDNYLLHIAAASADDIWSVGYYLDNSGMTRTLTAHWDGARWSTMPSPNQGSGENMLKGVAAIATDDVWAVGDYAGSSGRQTLIEHWNGSSWVIMPSPNPGIDNYLNAIAASPGGHPATDIWVVGSQLTAEGVGKTLNMHWDGAAWTVFPGDPGSVYGGSRLYALAALSSNDVWAVGIQQNSVYPDTLTMHWDGQQWTTVDSPSPGVQYEDVLTGVTAVSTNDVWAAGYNFFNGVVQTLTIHWDGQQWTYVPSPNVGGGANLLGGIVASSGSDVWAVGGYAADNQGAVRTLALHWDGSSWGIADSPNPSSLSNVLNGVTTVEGSAGHEIWAVGYQVGSSGTARTLVERYSHSCVAPTPTGTVTPSTTPAATRTTGPTTTPNPGCPGVPFSDVCPSDYFYAAVVYLNEHGAVSGYADGTFRPYNNATRGQVCKIIVLAEGWQLNTQGGPHFTDVPSSNPFYAFIETAYSHGIISGYDDHTFRWGNNITRGQLCKVMVLAEQWPIDTAGGPHFTDVPTTHPFYAFIETALSKDIVSGYSDGTFRPGNNATRGQICKIVYIAITQ